MMRVGKLASDNLRLGNGVSPIFQPRQVSLRQVYIDPPSVKKVAVLIYLKRKHNIGVAKKSRNTLIQFTRILCISPQFIYVNISGPRKNKIL